MRFRVPAVAESPMPTPISATTPQFPKLKLNAPSQSIPKITLPRCELRRCPLCSIHTDGSRVPPAQPTPGGYYDTVPQTEFEAEPVPFNLVDPPAKKVKIKAPPKPEQSQAAGMSLSDVTACKSMLKKLMKDKNATFFKFPVGTLLQGLDHPALFAHSHFCTRGRSCQVWRAWVRSSRLHFYTAGVDRY